MNRKLLLHGMVLFLLGLLTGLAAPQLRNMRMGISAHLEGVLNGMFLLGLGLAWGEIRLPERARKLAAGLVLYGAYANWTATLLAAALGASKLTPVAGAGFTGSAAAEALVSLLLVTVALSMVAAVSLFIAGLRTKTDTAAQASTGTI